MTDIFKRFREVVEDRDTPPLLKARNDAIVVLWASADELLAVVLLAKQQQESEHCYMDFAKPIAALERKLAEVLK